MRTHELVISSLGPWATPPKPHLAAYCTCNTWSEAWSEDELRALLKPGQTFLDTHASRVAAGIRQHHLQHLAALIKAEAKRAAKRPGPDFYG